MQTVKLCTLVLMVALGLTGHAYPDELWVKKTTCDKKQSFCSIQAAIDAAAEGDVISIVAGDFDLWQESLSISKSITLQGAGSGDTRLLGEGKSPSALLTITENAQSVLLRGLSLQDRIVTGSSTMGPGALDHRGSDLILEDVSFINNRGGWGGAVRIQTLFGSVTFENCLFEANYGFAGAAIAAYDGSALELSITDSVFKNNNAVFSGGALLTRDAADVLLSNVTMENNSSGNTGGAAHFFTDTGESSVRITNSHISRNKASKSGGVSTAGSAVSVSIDGTSFSGNQSHDSPKPADCAGSGFKFGDGNQFEDDSGCQESAQ